MYKKQGKWRKMGKKTCIKDPILYKNIYNFYAFSFDKHKNPLHTMFFALYKSI